MTDPYRPRVRRASGETQDPEAMLDHRLRLLGASDADVRAFREAWGGATAVGGATDSTLAEMLAAARGEGYAPPPSDPIGEPDPEAGPAMGADPLPEPDVIPPSPPPPPSPGAETPEARVPAGLMDGPAAAVMAWVGRDRGRAAAALAAERRRDQPRVTLVARLESRLGASG